MFAILFRIRWYYWSISSQRLYLLLLQLQRECSFKLISLAASKIEVKFPSSFWQLLKTLIKICSFSNKQPIYIPTCGNPTCAKLSVNDVIIYQFALDCHFLFEPYLSTANADNVTISFFKVSLPNSNTICRSSRIFLFKYLLFIKL